MKKRWVVWTALLLVAAIGATMFALAEGDALSLFTGAKKLAFETGNVTLSAEAKFTYDGAWFKTFRGDYRQDGENSFMRVMMDTPNADGSVYTGGYTVVGNGDTAYSNDTYFGNYYVETPLAPNDTVLRETSMTSAGLAVVEGAIRALSADMDAIVKKTSKDGASEYAISLTSAPELVNAALTYVTLDYIGKNYYFYEPVSYCYSEYEDYDALFAVYYRQLYGEDVPEGFVEGIMDGIASEKDIQKYSDVYTALYAAGDARTAQYDTGIVWQRADGSYEWFADQAAYLRAANLDYVYYDDYMSAFAAYYQSITGEAFTNEMYNAIVNTGNDELWTAYMEMSTAMEQNYTDIAAQDPETVAITVKADGTYETLTELPDNNPNRTVTQQILSSVSKFELAGANVTVGEDASGNLTSGSGKVTITVTDKDGNAHALEIEFTCSATAYGDTYVGAFDPDEYGFVSYEQYMEGVGEAYYEDYSEESYQEMLDSLPKTVTFGGVSYETMLGEQTSN